VKKVLFHHGWTNKRPEGHWMRLSTSKLRSTGHQVLYPQFPDPDTPHPDKWQELLRQEANMLDEIQGGEKILVAHSLGTINFIYGCLDEIFNNPFDRVLLVAPPDPIQTGDTEGIQGEPLDLSNPMIEPAVNKWAKRLSVIASDNDRWLPRGVGIYKAPLGVEPLIYPGAGHFSLDDGWGEWPGLIRWIETGNDQDLIS
jgi:predicted alpha/beta hydrolase family esterase